MKITRTNNRRFALLDFFFGWTISSIGRGLIDKGSGAGIGIGPSSSSTSIISSTGWIVSISSRPGASGIGPNTKFQIESIADAVIGFSTQPIAPAE